MYLGNYTREEKMCPQDAVFLQYSLESVVSSERLLEKRSFSTASEDCKRSPLFYAQAVHYSSMMVVKVRVSLSFGCNLRMPCLCSMAWSR